MLQQQVTFKRLPVNDAVNGGLRPLIDITGKFF